MQLMIKLTNLRNHALQSLILMIRFSSGRILLGKDAYIMWVENNLPQHARRRRIWPFPTWSALVVACNEVDGGSDSHVWLSGRQKRASCTRRYSSTKHLVQLWNILLGLCISDNLLVHVPYPAWAIIMAPDLDQTPPRSRSSELDSSDKSTCQLGHPITPNTISPSTTRAKPTCNFSSTRLHKYN